MVCSTCGADVPDDARFCPNCGAPLGQPVTEERKIVTALFADLAGSTELANRLDPERFREVIQAFYQAVSRELSSLRGRAEKFVGDAVMAVFGLPHAHDDDALRAVRAGLIICDRTERLGETLGLPLPLRVRVGINSGAVAVGPGGPDQPLVIGAGVNLAARLQQAADPGEVLAGETTMALTREFVRFGERRVVAAKGFEDVIAAPVLELAPRSARRTIPIVGRSREQSLVLESRTVRPLRHRAHAENPRHLARTCPHPVKTHQFTESIHVDPPRTHRDCSSCGSEDVAVARSLPRQQVASLAAPGAISLAAP